MRGLEQNQILEGNIAKGMLKLAYPLIILSFINSLYSIVDTFWVGRLGELEVGAISLIAPISECGAAFASGLTAAAMALIAMAIGARNIEKSNRLATILIELCVGIGVLIGAICIFAAKPILNWLETPANIYDSAAAYLFGISFDFVCMFILNIFVAIRQSNGDSKTGVKINTIAALINVVLDPILMFGFHLGIFGAALATTLSKVITTPIALYILISEKDMTRVDFKRYYKPQFEEIKEIITVAIPASIGSFLSSFGFVLMNKSIVSYGSVTMAAYGLGNRISGVFYIPMNGIAGALTPFIGQNLGAKNVERTKECYRTYMKINVIGSMIVTVIGMILTKYLVYAFVSEPSPSLLKETCEYAYYCILTGIFMGWFNGLNAVFNGSGHTKYTLFLNSFRLWGLRIPMIYLFSHYTGVGATGIWWSMCLSNIIICVLGQILYKVKPWYNVGVKNA